MTGLFLEVVCTDRAMVPRVVYEMPHRMASQASQHSKASGARIVQSLRAL
jgi:hypothetical protein